MREKKKRVSNLVTRIEIPKNTVPREETNKFKDEYNPKSNLKQPYERSEISQWRTGVLIKLPIRGENTVPGIVLEMIKNHGTGEHLYNLHFLDASRLLRNGRVMTDLNKDYKKLQPSRSIDKDDEQSSKKESVTIGDKVLFKSDAVNTIHRLEYRRETFEDAGIFLHERRSLYENRVVVENFEVKFSAILILDDTSPITIWTDLTGLYEFDASDNKLILPEVVIYNGNLIQFRKLLSMSSFCPKVPIMVYLYPRVNELSWNLRRQCYSYKDFQWELANFEDIKNFEAFVDEGILVKKHARENAPLMGEDGLKPENINELLMGSVFSSIRFMPSINSDMINKEFYLRRPLVVKSIMAIVTGRHSLLVPRQFSGNNTYFNRSLFPVQFSRRDASNDTNLDAGQWVKCDLFLSQCTSIWIARIKYKVNDVGKELREIMTKKWKDTVLEKKTKEIFEQQFESIRHCDNLHHYIDETNTYHISVDYVRTLPKFPRFFYNDCLGLIYDRCFMFKDGNMKSYLIDVSKSCSIARMETTCGQVVKPIISKNKLVIKESYGLVIEHRLKLSATVLYSPLDTTSYEILIPSNEIEVFPLGTILIFDAVFFQEKEFHDEFIHSKGKPYYRVTHAKTVPGFPKIDVRLGRHPIHQFNEFKVCIIRKRVHKEVELFVWHNCLLGSIEDPDSRLPLEGLEIEISTPSLVPSKKEMRKTKSFIQEKEMLKKRIEWVWVAKGEDEALYQADFFITDLVSKREYNVNYPKAMMNKAPFDKDLEMNVQSDIITMSRQYPLPPEFKFPEVEGMKTKNSRIEKFFEPKYLKKKSSRRNFEARKEIDRKKY